MTPLAGLRDVKLIRDEGGELEMEPLLTAAQVARILSVRLKRVYELGIPAVRLSEKTLRWRRSAVLTWLDQRTERGSR